MTTKLASLAMIGALGLSGCAVVSQEPLFTPADAAKTNLADGLWALAGPGCDVAPGAPLPECAAPVVIDQGKMRWDTGAALARSAGPMGPMLSALPVPKTSAYLLADGDPMIMELINGASNDPPPPGAPPRPPLKPGYLALRPIGRTPSGAIDRAILWPVRCPPPEAHVADFKIAGAQCLVDNVDALREAARTPVLLQSAFLIRVGPAPTR